MVDGADARCRRDAPDRKVAGVPVLLGTDAIARHLYRGGPCSPAPAIEGNWRRTHATVGARRAELSHGANELLELERLFHCSLEAELCGGLDGCWCSRDEQDRHFVQNWVSLHDRDAVRAGHAGHHVVHDHQVRPLQLSQRQRLDAVACDAQVVALLAEDQRQQ